MAPRPIPPEVLQAAWENLPAVGSRTLRQLRDSLRRAGCTDEDIDAHFAPELESFLKSEYGGRGCAVCRANWLRSWRPDAAVVAQVIRDEGRRHGLAQPEEAELVRRIDDVLHGERKLWACVIEGILTERECATALLARVSCERSRGWEAVHPSAVEEFIAAVERALFPWPAPNEHAIHSGGCG